MLGLSTVLVLDPVFCHRVVPEAVGLPIRCALPGHSTGERTRHLAGCQSRQVAVELGGILIYNADVQFSEWTGYQNLCDAEPEVKGRFRDAHD